MYYNTINVFTVDCCLLTSGTFIGTDSPISSRSKSKVDHQGHFWWQDHILPKTYFIRTVNSTSHKLYFNGVFVEYAEDVDVNKDWEAEVNLIHRYISLGKLDLAEEKIKDLLKIVSKQFYTKEPLSILSAQGLIHRRRIIGR